MKKKILTSLFLLLIFCLSLANVSAIEDTTETIQLTSDVNEISVAEENLAISQDEELLTSSEIYVNGSVMERGNGSVESPYSTISDAVSSANDGDIILIASGKYSGNGNVAITIDKEIIITSYGDEDVILDGESTSSIFYVTSSNVVIDGLTFINGNAINGAAIYYESGSKNNIINNSKFINNYASSCAGAVFYDSGENSQILNSVFENNSAYYGGAILYLYDSSDNVISNTNFTGNNAFSDNGGAIYYFYGSSNCLFNNTQFEANTALYNGGAIYYYWTVSNISFIESSFKNNKANYGSAIYAWYVDSLTLNNSIFEDNKAVSNSLSSSVDKFNKSISAEFQGGNNIMNAICSESLDNYDVFNVTFWNENGLANTENSNLTCSYYASGQNITCEIYDSVTNECIFNETKSSDENGSVIFDYSFVSSENILNYNIYHSDDAYYTFIETSGEFNPIIGDFEALQNLIDKSGENEVIDLTRNYTYTIGVDTITEGININKNNLTINGNGYVIDALGQSRIFYIQSQSFNLNNITLANGYSSSNGGAVYAGSDLSGSTFDNVNFENNSAKNGGAVYFAKNAVNNTFSNSKFTDSKATAGGAVNAAGSFNENIITNTTFSNNSVNAIYLRYSSNNQFVNSCFINNSRAINFYGQSKGNKFINSTFVNNSASKNGGALCFKDVDSNEFINVTFENNSVTSKGGAMFFEGTVKNITITNTAFENNSATSNGGAIAFDEDSEFTGSVFENVSFINNRGVYGGSIYCDNVELTDIAVSNSRFINNSAKNGGAISYVGCIIENMDYVNVSFIGNVHNASSGSTTGGGAISYYASTTSSNERIINSTFISNSATYGGGAIYYYSSSSTDYSIINTTFVNNSATHYAGAIYLGSMSNGKINNITCINNSAASGGAIYFIRDCHDNEISNSLFVNNSVNAIRYYNGPSNDNIINSVFIDNGDDEIIYSSSSTLSANYNWFGNNASNFNARPYVSSNINITNWMFLNATVSNNTVYVGDENSIIFVLEVYDSNSEAIIDEQYQNINWINLNLTSYNESLSKNNSFINDDIEFLASDDGTGNITARYFTSEYTVEFSNIKYNSSVFIDDVNSTYGTAINITANCTNALGIEAVLLDENGTDISGDYLEINGFNITISVIDVGRYTLNVTTIVGNNSYSSSNSSIITVSKANSTVNIEDVVVNYGEIIDVVVSCENVSNISAVLYDSLGNVVYSNMSVDGFNISISNLTVGNYTLNVTAIVDNNYNGSFNSSRITVNKANATLIINSTGDIDPTEEEIISVSLSGDVDGSLVYYINGDYCGSVENNTVVLNNLTEGNYTVVIALVNDTNYNECSNYTTFSVNKVNSTVDVYVENINVGENATVSILLPGDASGNVTFGLNGNYTVIDINESTVFGLNGVLSMPIVLNSLAAGNYSVEVTYNGNSKYYKSDSSANFTVNKISDYNISYIYDGLLNVSLPQDAAGNVSVQIDNYTYVSPINEGVASINLSDLAAGDYNITITYDGDDIYSPIAITGNISVPIKYMLIANDLEKYYGGNERFYAYLYDENGSPIANENITISINGVSYVKTSDENGSVSIGINLNCGEYAVSTSYGELTLNSTVTVLSTVIGNDIVKVFRNDTQYCATFLDSSGNYLPNGTEVIFNINGVFYTRLVNDEGKSKLNINLNSGEYIITATNPVTGQNYSNSIKVTPRITENTDLVKYFKNDSQYVVRLIGDDGNPVGSGEMVTFNINGVFYNRTTNESGYAKLNINLYSGDYVITAEYKGFKVSNNITVLPILYAEDLVMSYMDGTTFNAKLLDGHGDAFANEKVQFNINGVLYYRATNSSGIAKLNINLMPGEYVITSSYGDYNIANTILIREVQ